MIKVLTVTSRQNWVLDCFRQVLSSIELWGKSLDNKNNCVDQHCMECNITCTVSENSSAQRKITAHYVIHVNYIQCFKLELFAWGNPMIRSCQNSIVTDYCICSIGVKTKRPLVLVLIMWALSILHSESRQKLGCAQWTNYPNV